MNNNTTTASAVKRVVGTRLEEAVYKLIREAAKADNRSVSSLIRIALLEKFDPEGKLINCLTKEVIK